MKKVFLLTLIAIVVFQANVVAQHKILTTANRNMSSPATPGAVILMSAVADKIKAHAALGHIHPYTGDVAGNNPNISAGNKTDGDGYFMPGSQNNSFFYYVNRSGNVYANWGPIRDAYTKAGYEFGILGWPADDEYKSTDGVGFYQHFDHGVIFSHPTRGTYMVKGKILEYWAKNGYEKGAYGYPIDEERSKPLKHATDVYQRFQNGFIEYIEDTRTHEGRYEAGTNDRPLIPMPLPKGNLKSVLKSGHVIHTGQ